MSVIGRLDKQVEDILINPLNNQEREEKSLQTDSTRKDTRTNSQTASTNPSSKNQETPREELPVWLL